MSRSTQPGTHGGAAAWFLLVLLVALTACSASRYEVLSFFFDGVPDPNAPPPAEVEERTKLNLTTRPVLPPTAAVHMHEPYLQRRCEACHKGGGDKTRRTAGAFAINTMSELLMPADKLCISCHQPSTAAFQHAPALLGDCSRCHAAHSSRFPHLLLQEKSKTLCASCHTEETMTTGEQHAARGNQDCVECHDPHGSDLRFLLRPAPAEPPSAPAAPLTGPPEPERRGGD